MTVDLAWQDLMFLLVPALIAIINRPSWPSGAKWLVAVGICFMAALAQVYLTGAPAPENFHLALGKALALVMGAYGGFWKPTKISDFIETNINAGGPPKGPGA